MDFKKFSEMILIEQTLFALPFAYLGLLFAGGGSIMDWVWVTVALVAARTAGMSFNRVIDMEIDRRNPRTKDRILARGDAGPAEVLVYGAAASLVLIFAAYMLNTLCFYLSFVAVAMLATYSYFKRFTSSSHYYLGLVELARKRPKAAVTKFEKALALLKAQKKERRVLVNLGDIATVERALRDAKGK